MKHFYLMILAACASLTTMAQIPTNGLVARYTFESNFADQSGNNLNLCDGTGGAEPLVLQASGNNFQPIGDSAVYFNGASYLDAACSSVNGEFNSTSASISAWFKVDEFNSYNTIACVRYNNTSSPYNSINLFTGLNVSGKLAMAFSSANTEVPWPTTDVIVQTTTTLETGTWYHATCTFDETTGTGSIYLNSVLEAYTSIGYGPLLQAGNALTIGHVNGGVGNNGFIGMVDEVLYFSRVLTAEEICEIYGGDCIAAPAAPALLTLSTPYPETPNAVLVSWDDVALLEDGYTVERSTDGVIFENVIGGSSLPANSEALEDAVPGIGTYYYKVCAFNAAGTSCSSIQQITISSMIGVEESSQIEMNLFPNPATSFIQIKSRKNTVATITNALGKTVMTTTIHAGTNSIDISALANGVYTLRTTQGTSRFIKE